MRTRANTSIILVFFMIFLVVDSVGGRNDQQTESTSSIGEPPPYKIASVEAFLYYQHSGKLSENVIENPKFALWNVIIGAGSAEGPSNETLVVVKVKGQPGALKPGRKLEFLAKTGGKTILSRTSEIHILSGGNGIVKLSHGESGVYFVPFWLYDTGCEVITISARILGQTDEANVEKKIAFECGE